MSILVRRINIGMWRDYCASATCFKPFISALFSYPKYNAPGDIITNALSTSGDALSFWKIEDESKINDAILAMCTGTTQSNVGTIYYVLFDEKELNLKGIEIVQSTEDANTAILELKRLHHNMKNISYYTLGQLQDLIVEKIKSGEEQKLTKGDIKPLIKQKITEGKIDYSLLSNDYLRHLRDDFKDLKDRIPERLERMITCPNCSTVFGIQIEES